MIFSKDYFKLFVRREGRVIGGRKGSNLWLLTAVLTLTFLATAFSDAALNYLSYRMNDPFINWVDIERDSDRPDYAGLYEALQDTAVCAAYHIAGYQEDYRFSYEFIAKDDKLRYLTGRFFQRLNTPLIEEILNGDNLIGEERMGSADRIDAHSIGVILTGKTLELLGYETVPAFVNFARWSLGADTLGFDLLEGYARIPLPVLGAVKRLPGNADFIAAACLLEQDLNDRTYPFHLNNPEYASSLIYFVPEQVDMESFENTVLSAAAARGIELSADENSFYMPELLPMHKGDFVLFLPAGDFARNSLQDLNREVLAQYTDTDLTRVYPYDFSESHISEKSFLSVHFQDLSRIRAFEAFAGEGFDVYLEMSQINTKENFNSVSVLGNLLSWAIVAFSLICIVLFIVNLLQSYFQKIRQNIGTFKAFGISNRELGSIYVLIVTGVIAAAAVLSLAVTFLIQCLLPLFGILKDGIFPYLSLWNAKTGCALCIILVTAMATVHLVMKHLLTATPGDLIYGRES